MRHLSIGIRILGIVLATGLVLGCEESQPPETPAVYDPAVDAPPSPLVVDPSPNLLEDQAKLARGSSAVSTASGSTSPGATPGSMEDPRVKAVRVNVSKMIEAAKGDKLPSVAGYASAKDADAMRTFLTALAAFQEDERAVLAAVKTHTGKDAPASLTQIMERGPDGGPFLARLHEMSIDDLAFTPADANTVTVKDQANMPLTFTKVDDKWVITLSDAETKVYAVLGELAPLQAQAAKELAEGLASGIINEASLNQVVMEKAKGMADFVARLKEAMEAAKAAKAGEAGNRTE